MRVDILGLIAVLVTTVAADAMVSYTMCLGPCYSWRAIWYTSFGAFTVDASEGCRDPPDVPGMWSLCMDWGNSRGHFMMDGQPKRCIRKQASRGTSLPSAKNKKKTKG
jgi:hypothetical protein